MLNMGHNDPKNTIQYISPIDVPSRWNDTDGQYVDFAPFSAVPGSSTYDQISYDANHNPSLMSHPQMSHPLYIKTTHIWDKLRVTAAIKISKMEMHCINPSQFDVKLFTLSRSTECLDFFSPSKYGEIPIQVLVALAY